MAKYSSTQEMALQSLHPKHLCLPTSSPERSLLVAFLRDRLDLVNGGLDLVRKKCICDWFGEDHQKCTFFVQVTMANNEGDAPDVLPSPEDSSDSTMTTTSVRRAPSRQVSNVSALPNKKSGLFGASSNMINSIVGAGM